MSVFQACPLTGDILQTVRKDNLTSHQRVHTSELALNRRQNAFQTHLTQC